MSKQCPKCEQFKVMTQAGMTIMVGMVINFIGFILMIFILPIGFIVAGIGLILFSFGIVSYFVPSMRKKLYCSNCHYQWEEK